MRTKDLFYWIKERYSILQKKDAGKPKPWTMDPILQTYRFCNVHRENDTVTRWIAKNWREPHAGEPNLFFAMTVARLLNLPSTLEWLGYPVPWDNNKRSKFMKLGYPDKGVRVFNSAYIVSTNGVAMNKVDYLKEYVLDPLWEARRTVTDHLVHADSKGMTLDVVHAKLTNFRGLGSFMAAQVIADIKYVEPLRTAPDWNTFAASGPGSRRGLNRVLGQDTLKGWNETRWHTTLMDLKEEIDPLVKKAGIPPIHAQDLQNCLCEFDKYERVRLNEGRPKSLYPGAA